MAFAPYATRPEFKAWVVLNDTIDDVVMDECLAAASRWIDDYCDRHFWQDGTVGTPVARTFTPCSNGCRCIDIDDLVSVTTLKTDDAGDGTYETTWSASDFQLQPVNRPTGHPYTQVEAVGSLTFPARTAPGSRANRVEITGVWGWGAIPAPVHTACLIEASKELKRRFSPEGVAGFGEFGLVRISSKPVDPTVEQLLSPYTRTSRTTGVLVA
jgi:hypothetical protein